MTYPGYNGVAGNTTAQDMTNERKASNLEGNITGTVTTTAPSAGGAAALPATPAGYVMVSINGVNRQIPYY
jgi:hypothetical protein